MCQLLETIRIKNNTLCGIGYHNMRLNNSRAQLFQVSDTLKLEEQILLTALNPLQTYKCRVIYGIKVESCEISPYIVPQINTLQLVSDDLVDYSYKYLDRKKLDQLKMGVNGTDDVLIVKNGCVTDTSFANIVFFDGSRWITPMYPLLKGTKRQFYLDKNIIFEKQIKVNDLLFFSKARIINAMIDLDESKDIEMKNIIS